MANFGDGDVAEHVDLELLAQVLERQELEGAGEQHARVVHEPCESRRPLDLLHVAARPVDRLGVGHLELDGYQPLGTRLGEGARVLLPAHSRKDAVAEPVQGERRGAADPGRGSRDDDAPFHSTHYTAPAPGSGELAL
jgi:hypothetical protein